MNSTALKIIKKDIYEKRISLVVYCLSGALMVWLYVSLFPSLQAQAGDLTKIMQNLPKDILKAFGAQGTGLENVESFLAGKQFGLVWPVLVIILMLSRSAGAIAGEVESGTIGTLLSQPISRVKIFLSKYISAVITLGVFVVTTVLVNIPIIAAYRLEFNLRYELLFAVVCMLLGLAVLSSGIAVSAIVSEKSRAYGIVGGLVALMFVVNIVSSLKEELDPLKYVSLFYYFSPHSILVDHHINIAAIAVFSITTIAGFIIGLIAFNRRDMSI